MCVFVYIYTHTHLTILIKEKEAIKIRKCVGKLEGRPPGWDWRDDRARVRDTIICNRQGISPTILILIGQPHWNV